MSTDKSNGTIPQNIQDDVEYKAYLKFKEEGPGEKEIRYYGGNTYIVDMQDKGIAVTNPVATSIRRK